jgi:hypothetical protein
MSILTQYVISARTAGPLSLAADKIDRSAPERRSSSRHSYGGGKCVASDNVEPSPDEGARELPLSAVAEFLASQRQAITDQWVISVRRDDQIETADRLTYEQLLDQLPRLFEELCAFLRERDPTLFHTEVRADAEEHGESRWKDGYRIDELLRELGAFRHIVATQLTRFRGVDLRFTGTIESTANALLHQFFTEMTIASVRQFVREQQARLHARGDKLASANDSLERSRATLQQALADRRRLTTTVAQELEHVIRGLARAAGAYDQDEADAADSGGAEVVAAQARLEQLFEHVNWIAGDGVVAATAYSPADLHAELLAEYLAKAQQRGLAIVAESSTAPATVVGDRAKARQIVANLLAHVIGTASAIEVSLVFATLDETYWSLVVGETGSISVTATPLLSALVRDASPVPKLGPGLGIARDMALMLGGSLSIFASAGTGTRIEVLLPRDLPPAPIRWGATPDRTPEAGTRRFRRE